MPHAIFTNGNLGLQLKDTFVRVNIVRVSVCQAIWDAFTGGS